MNELIKIEIVTPLELLKSKETKMSVLPGSEGELGIMSRHTPLMTLLNRGIIKLFDENNSVTDQIAVDGGVADVSEEGITVLSERAEILGSNASNKQIINEKINAVNSIACVISFQCFSSDCCKNPRKIISSPNGAEITTAMNNK